MPFRSNLTRLDRRTLLTAGGLLLAGATCRAGPVEAAPSTTVKVLMEELPPYSYTDAEGKPAGYAYELAQALLTRAGLAASFEFNSWTRVLLRSRDEAAVLLPAIVRLAEREPQFLWLGQIATRRGTLFKLKSRAEIQLSQISAARNYRIGVVKHDVSERELIALGVPTQQLDRSPDYLSLLRRFFSGRTDLLALNAALAPALLKQYGFSPGLIEPVLKFSDSRPSMALSLATDEATHQRLLQAWEAMRRDGSVAAIAARHSAIALD